LPNFAGLNGRISGAALPHWMGRVVKTRDTSESAPQVTVQDIEGGSHIVGAPRNDGRATLVMFVSPTCPVCKALLPVLKASLASERDWLDIVLASDGEPGQHARFVKDKGLSRFPYVLSEHLGRSFGVAKLPYAVLIDETGKLSATGLVNTREHLESLFVAKESGVANIQQFLRSSDPRRASSGE